MATNRVTRGRLRAVISAAAAAAVVAFVAFGPGASVAFGDDSSPSDSSVTSTTTSTTSSDSSSDAPASDADTLNDGEQQEGGGSDESGNSGESGDSTQVETTQQSAPEDDQSSGDGQSSGGSDSSDSASSQDDSAQTTAGDSGDSNQGDSGDGQSSGDSQQTDSSAAENVVSGDGQSAGAEQTDPSTSADPVPVTVSTSQSGACPNFTGTATLSGDVPADLTITVTIVYGIPIDGFIIANEAYGPGLVAGQSYSVSFSTDTPLPPGADPGFPYFLQVQTSDAQLKILQIDTTCVTPPVDSDNDGVSDGTDLCQDTPAGSPVDANGCAESQKDDDNDGVNNADDHCANTPTGAVVDANGCADSQKDSDGDGKSDDIDQCPGTPAGTTVDDKGCPVSSPTTTANPSTSPAPTTTSAAPTTNVGQSTGSPQPTGNPGGTTNQQSTGSSGPTIVPVPAAPAIDDPAGPGNAHWVVPMNTSVLVWTASADRRHLSVSVVDPTKFAFAEGPTHDYGIACDSEGEQAAPVVTSANAGNPTPQPTANGGEGLRVSSGDGQTVRALGILCGIVALVIGVALTVRRRYTGQH